MARDLPQYFCLGLSYSVRNIALQLSADVSERITSMYLPYLPCLSLPIECPNLNA